MIMDLRDKSKVYQDGSSMIDFGFTGAALDEALGTTSNTPAWVRMAYHAGGDYGRDTDRQRQYDEGGTVVATTGTTNDWTIQNTTQQVDARTRKILKYLDTHEVPVRYFLPTTDPTKVTVEYHPAMSKDEGADRISTARGIRTLQYTLRGDNARHVFDDLPVVQTSWPAAFAGAKDTAFGS